MEALAAGMVAVAAGMVVMIAGMDMCICIVATPFYFYFFSTEHVVAYTMS